MQWGWNIGDVKVRNFILEVDKGNIFKCNGEIKDIILPERTVFDFQIDQILCSSRFLSDNFSDIKKYSPGFDGNISISGNVSGSSDSIATELFINSSYGPMNINGFVSQLKGKFFITAEWIVNNINAGSLTGFNSLGKLNSTGKIDLAMDSSGISQLHSTGDFNEIAINSNKVSGLHFIVGYTQKFLTVNIIAKDSLADFNFTAESSPAYSGNNYKAKLNMARVDLGKLGLSPGPMELNGSVVSSGYINRDSVHALFEIRQANLNAEENYQVKDFKIDISRFHEDLKVLLSSHILTGDFRSNIRLSGIPGHLKTFFNHYLAKADSSRLRGMGLVSLYVQFNEPSRNLAKLIPGLNELDLSELKINFDESQSLFRTKLICNKINFKDLLIDSASFLVRCIRDSLMYNINIPGLVFRDYKLPDLNFTGRSVNYILQNSISMLDSTGFKLFQFNFNVTRPDSNSYKVSLGEAPLVLNHSQWNPDRNENFLLIHSGVVEGKAAFINSNQKISLESKDSVYSIIIDDLDLGIFKNLVVTGKRNLDFSGSLTLNSEINNSKINPSLDLELKTSDLKINNVYLGVLSVYFKPSPDHSSFLDLNINGNGNQLRLTGNYNPHHKVSPIDCRLNFSFDKLSEYEPFMPGIIHSINGSIKGDLKINGTPGHVITDGWIDFSALSFFAEPLRSSFAINNQRINFNDKGINFDNFSISDLNRNLFIINGRIKNEGFSDAVLDLKADLKNFTLFNRDSIQPGKAADIYGKMIISASGEITGHISEPNVKMSLIIENGTSLTYVMPAQTIGLETFDGIVEFKQPEEILSPNNRSKEFNQDTIFNRIKGFNIVTDLEIKQGAGIFIEVDPDSGDKISISSIGNLNLGIDRTGNARMTGKYEILRGNYNVSFYDLIKKEFEFKKGSNVIWTGDPYDAKVDIIASYIVRTPSMGLVANEISGLSDEAKNAYRKPLPFEVDIILSNNIKSPALGFQIDLPAEFKTAYPLVGTKLNRLNEQGNESLLAQQVFGLLTIGSFIPETSGIASSTYGSAIATTAAANSLNGIFTNQLNGLSSRYISFIDLNVGMNTYSDVAGSSQSTRTTMDIKASKKLFNERVIIEAESSFDISGNKSPANTYSSVQNDFAIIYDLTRAGDYKLKLFDKSAYDIIYKDIRTSGIALFFIKDLDDYKKK